jgi:anthranilate synthase component 1
MFRINLDFTTFQKIAKTKTIVPVFKKINSDFLTPVMAYLKLRDSENYSFLFESVVKGEQLGRYSFLGRAPVDSFASNPNQLSYSSNGNRVIERNFFMELKAKLQAYDSIPVESLPRFTGGAVGYIGYDMIQQIEDLPEPKPDPINIPNAILAFYHELIAFDHLKSQVILIANVMVEENSDLKQLYKEAEFRIQSLFERLNRPLPEGSTFYADLKDIDCNFSKEDFEKAVDKSKEFIFAGDIFQVVLSRRSSLFFRGDIFQVYRSLRNINPSPYMFYLDFLDFQLIGSSPEPLIRVENQEAEIIPIAGTRPRGKTPADDDLLAENLLNDPKELAEHVMLVDLARNDMGRVSKHGTVKVFDFQTIERYSHVMHIISRVKGTLRENFDAVDAFCASFPAGTVSGAPKIRAMEIINHLEPEKRGFYAGAIGYFDYGGNMDMCIAIRTLLAKNGKLYFQAGAGIVADSVPETEYFETINKGNALTSAITAASGGLHDFMH